MAFGREGAVVPQAIADIAVTLFDPDPTGAEQRSATVTVQVRMDDGSLRVRTYNLVDHLPAQTIAQLIDFMTDIRNRAVTQILPEVVNP